MVKRGISTYLILGVLILGIFFAVYFFNPQFTGFAIFEQSTQADFDEGGYENLEYNGSAVVLSENQTNGTYTSKIFNTSENVLWNNLSWSGQGNLSFEVRSCSSENCTNSSFVIADLTNLNLSGQYFQYRVFFYTNETNETLFLESVILDYSPPLVTSVSISEPSGEKSSVLDVPIQFSVMGNDLTCWYDVKNSNGDTVIGETTLTACANSDFDLTSDGDYIITIYANGSSGFAFGSSTFSVSTPSDDEEDEEETAEEENEQTTQQSQTIKKIANLTLQAIETPALNPSASKSFELIVRNTGDFIITNCKLISEGEEFSPWLITSNETKDFSLGEEKIFSFSVNIPEDVQEATYVFPIKIWCDETVKNSEFSVEVVKKKIGFNLKEVQRTGIDRLSVEYSLEELLDKEQTVELEFLLYDSINQQVANKSEEQILPAGGEEEFKTEILTEKSLEENITLVVNFNSEKLFSSIIEPVKLRSPTGFFVFGNNIGTTGNVLAIIMLLVVGMSVFFLIKRKDLILKLKDKLSPKNNPNKFQGHPPS